MKIERIFFFVLLLCFSTICSWSQEQIEEKSTIERIYVSTDKECYVAGESIWISMFCFNVADSFPKLSKISAVAYVELRSLSGVAAKTKIALFSGRGSGNLELPLSTPTGNYRLIAYTSHMLNEKKVIYFDKVVSVFNTLTNERDSSVIVENGDSLLITDETTTLETQPILMEAPKTVILNLPDKPLKSNSNVQFSFSNKYDKEITMCVSIVNEDKISTYKNLPIYNYIASGYSNVESMLNFKFIPEYEGEIIKGGVSIANSKGDINKLVGQTAFLSVLGGDCEVYTSSIDSLGRFTFYTTNVYGNTDLIFELPYLDTNYKFNVALDDNFLYPDIKKIPSLVLKPIYSEDLLKRGISMQLGKRYGVDSLFTKEIPFHNPLFSGNCISYLLDNYTRFPVMEEVMIEFIPELRFRRIDKNYFLQVRWESSFRELSFSRDNSLTVVDGVPVFNHNVIHDYDPLKVKKIDIYGGTYSLGDADFTGIVFFKTYKGDFPNYSLPVNARILAFNGATLPCRLIDSNFKSWENMPDYRTTIFWEPNIRLLPNESLGFEFHVPDYSGTFVITVEGIDSSGSPIYLQTKFTTN